MRPAQRHEVETFMEQTPFNKVMSIWADWHTLKDRQEAGGNANLQDVKDFMTTSMAVEVMVNDLPRHQWWAVRKSRSICTVWLFPSLNLLEALEEAEKILTPKMRQHIATRRFFD